VHGGYYGGGGCYNNYHPVATAPGPLPGGVGRPGIARYSSEAAAGEDPARASGNGAAPGNAVSGGPVWEMTAKRIRPRSSSSAMTIVPANTGRLTAMLGLLLLALPGSGSALSFGSRVSLKSVETGKCLDVAANAPNGSAPVAVECRPDTVSQMFWLWGNSGWFHIQSAASGKCLDVGLAQWRFNPYIYDCTWGQPQRFRCWQGRVGVIESHERPNECFDFGLQAWNLASPYLYSCWGGAPQQFTVTP